MIITGQRYEAEPAVEAYVKDLQAENEEQRREILRLTDELKEMDGANEEKAKKIYFDRRAKKKAESEGL